MTDISHRAKRLTRALRFVSGQSSYPESLQTTEIEIVLPEGPKTIPNPLFSYTFHPLPNWTFDSNWQGSASTLRQPEMLAQNYTEYQVELHTDHNPRYNETVPVNKTRLVRDPNAPSRNDVVAKNLDGNRRNIQLRVYNLLAFEHDYLKMSSEVQGPNNMENIHGTIHNTVGGVAHMWNLRYSAFDPIFWLHHSNVDRLFAIWEALNTNYSVPSWANKAQTFTMPAGIPTDGDTRKSHQIVPYHSITFSVPLHTQSLLHPKVRSSQHSPETLPQIRGRRLLDLQPSPQHNRNLRLHIPHPTNLDRNRHPHPPRKRSLQPQAKRTKHGRG